MPGGNTKFQKSWLDQKDSQGCRLSEWCKADPKCNTKAFCFLCQKSISCENAGIVQVLQHAKGAKHQSVLNLRNSKSQRHFVVSRDSSKASGTNAGETLSARDSPVSVIQDRSFNEKVTSAEVLWAIKSAHADFSFSASDGVPELFRRMFPSPVTDEFTMSRTKLSYLISDGLGPYFKKTLCEDISRSSSGYTIHYDETSNAQGRKQCDILVRYWSDQSNQVEVRFLKTLFFGHAKGADVADKILATVQEEGNQIPLSGLLSLSSDGPNVNKTIWVKVNESLKEAGFPGLLPFIPCNLHIVHNAFRAGLVAYGEEVEELALDLFLWIKGSSCRREDFRNVLHELQLDDTLFIRHVQCRWLTLIPALQNIIKKWEAIRQYFLQDLPRIAKDDGSLKAVQENGRYIRICRKLQDKKTNVQIQFLVSLDPIFKKYLLFFQTEGPLVHILHDALGELLKSFMQRFLKDSVVGTKEGKALLTVDYNKTENHLSSNDLEIGQGTRTALSKLPPEERKLPILSMKKFFRCVTKYLVEHLPLGSQFLKDLTYLHPLMKTQTGGASAIRRIAILLPTVPEEQVALASDEWRMYQEQDVPENWISFTDDEENVKFCRIDSYWSKIFDTRSVLGQIKYPNLKLVVRGALSVAHGNADVERSLSVNKRTLTPDRTSLGDTTINALRIVKEEARIQSGPQNVRLTKPMLQAAKMAHQNYKKRVQQEKEEAEAKRRKREEANQVEHDRAEELKQLQRNKDTLWKKEEELRKSGQELSSEMKSAETLYNEANQRLSSAIKTKDFEQATVAQGLLEVASKKMEGARAKLKRNMESRDSIDSKKKKLMDALSKAAKKV